MNTRLATWLVVAMGVCGGCSLRGGNATLRDYTGLDGCGWVLESGGEVLEPINLESFLDAPEDGMRLGWSMTSRRTCSASAWWGRWSCSPPASLCADRVRGECGVVILGP
ncbi:MAG: hypothetical protein VYD51_05810 [Bacteroidota bacterium]|nr:hypothetical protein [Bacteroidota bacterium]